MKTEAEEFQETKEEICKEILTKAGYYVNNLWQVSDVNADISDSEKMHILDEVMQSDKVMEVINEGIENFIVYNTIN